jgi:hypothetical protein
LLLGDDGIELFGAAAVMGADFTGDGSPDLVVGAPGWEQAASSLAAIGDPGRVLVYTRFGSVPVRVFDFTASPSDRAVTLTWSLAPGAVFGLRAVRVESAPGDDGPWSVRTSLEPRAVMSFEDRPLGFPVFFRLVLVERTGEEQLGPILLVDAEPSLRTALGAVYMVPGGVRVEYRVGPVPTRVRLEVYDVAGRWIRSLEDFRRPPGSYALTWDRRDGAGRDIARGVYLLRLRAEGIVDARKLVVR